MLTQSRAIVLATIAAIVLVLIAAPGRTRRGVNLLIVLAAVAASAHWTLRVYSSTGPSQLLAPSVGAIRDAGLALLAAALIGVGLKALTSALSARLPTMRRERLTAQLGRALLALTVAGVLAGGVAEHQRLSTQWHDFTALKAEKSAGNRFLALGGGYRYDLWRIALDEFAAAPLGGVGAGNFTDQYYQRRHQLEDVTVPHSLELQMLAELGIGGAVGLGLLVAGVLAAGVDATQDSRSPASDAPLKIAALGMFTAWLAATSVDWLYDIPGLAGMAMLAAAVLVAPAPASHDATATCGAVADPVAPRPPRAAHTGGRHSGCWRWSPRASGVSMWRCSTATPGRASCPSIRCGRCRHCAPPSSSTPGRLPTQYAVASAYARLNDYQAARAALLHAAQLEPENYVPPALLGDIATRGGDRAAALAAYRRALRLDPLEPALQQAVAGSRGGTG